MCFGGVSGQTCCATLQCCSVFSQIKLWVKESLLLKFALFRIHFQTSNKAAPLLSCVYDRQSLHHASKPAEWVMSLASEVVIYERVLRLLALQQSQICACLAQHMAYSFVPNLWA